MKSYLLSALLVSDNNPAGIYRNNYAGSFNTLNAVYIFIEESSHLLGSFQILLESLKGAIEVGFFLLCSLKYFFSKLQSKNPYLYAVIWNV